MTLLRTIILKSVITQKKLILNGVLWFVGIVSLLFFSLGVTWKASTAINFNYSVWYDVLEINKTIEKYAKQNNFEKVSFQTTNKEQHTLLFAEIVNSVTHNGSGLQEIFYTPNDGGNVKLLTIDEVIHLQDVSELIDNLTIAWCLNVILLITLRYFLLHSYYEPSTKAKLLTVLTFILSIICVFSYFGFTTVFYYLHTVVFPDDHQWFFYYQDSLMSTLMKAPDLFGVIGIMLCIINIPIFYFSHKLFTVIGLKNR